MLTRRGFLGFMASVAAAVGLGAIATREVGAIPHPGTRVPFANNLGQCLISDIVPVGLTEAETGLMVYCTEREVPAVMRWTGSDWELLRTLTSIEEGDGIRMSDELWEKARQADLGITPHEAHLGAPRPDLFREKQEPWFHMWKATANPTQEVTHEV